MKILVLTQVLPYPPDSGPKVKTWNVIKYLARHHRVTLVSFVRGDQSRDIQELARYCQSIHTTPMTRSVRHDGVAMAKSWLTGQPWMIVRDDRAAMRRLVDQLSNGTPNAPHFDIAQADQLNMFQYAARVPGARKVLDAHNALWLLYKRLGETMGPGPKKWLLGRDWRLLKTYEGRICREADAVLAVSDEDRAALEAAMGQPSDMTVIPITVDTDEFKPVERQAGAGHVLHIGTMYWPPNVDGILWFIRQVYPRIRAERPDIMFDVVGARPPQEIVSLGGPGTGINVTGYVPDPTPFLQQAGVMIVPLRAGGGMRVKILNALSQGLPIVSTTLGCEGIDVQHGRHLLIADTPQEFAHATCSLLQNPELASALGRQGRELIQSKYDYRVACRALDDVYRRVSQESRPHTP